MGKPYCHIEVQGSTLLEAIMRVLGDMSGVYSAWGREGIPTFVPSARAVCLEEVGIPDSSWRSPDQTLGFSPSFTVL